jgi:putative membrane protein
MFLKPDDGAKVAAAIRAAEAKTDGEIAAIVSPSSDAYHDVVLHYALLVALLPLAISAAWPGLLEWGVHLLTGGWEEASLRLMLTLLLVKTAIVFLIARLIFGLPAMRMLLTPGATKTRRVHRRALMLFRAGTEQRTLSKTGVLLYLSLAEHRAEIVADAAIHSKAPQEAWGEAMAVLIEAIKDDRPGDGIASAIEKIGVVLAEHFPHTGTDPNEMPDRLIQL